MNNLSNYITEKLKINKKLKLSKNPVLLEARNLYLYQKWVEKYDNYIETPRVEFYKLFIISEKEAEDIIEETSKTCYWMYEWPIGFKNQEELETAFKCGEMTRKKLNDYPEFIKNSKL